MYRIKALNDSSEENSEDDLERVTKEAEETIIKSEYARALKLKVDGKTDEALSLFSELLEAELVDQVATQDEEAHALFSVKYNCLRNIGFLYAERGEQQQALQFLLKAVELDNNDIYTLTAVGKLALSIKQNYLARQIFERCQELNPNHWPSMYGLLDALIASDSIGAAFGWALHCYNKNPKHPKARQLLQEIVTDYPEMLAMLEKVYRKGTWSVDVTSDHDSTTEKLLRSNTEAVHCETESSSDNLPNIEGLKVSELNWVTLGNLIVQLYKRPDINHTATFTLEDFLLITADPGSPDSTTVTTEIKDDPTVSRAPSENEEKPMEVEFENNAPLGECDELDIDDNKMTAINKNGPSEIESLFGYITPDESQQGGEQDQVEAADEKIEQTELPPLESNEPPPSNEPSIPPDPVDLTDQNTAEPMESGEQGEPTEIAEATSETNTDNETVRDGVLLHPSISDLKDSAKRRRRGSELADLQQWGWHKNRRSKRKKIEIEEEPVDTSVNGFIRRILPKYFMESFDGDATLGLQKDSSTSCTVQIDTVTVSEFLSTSKPEFDSLTARLSSQSFDLVHLTCEYLKQLTSLWSRTMPEELHALFFKIFQIYSTFIDFDCLNLLSNEPDNESDPHRQLIDHVRIILFYLELSEDKSLVKMELFTKLYTVVQFYIGWLITESEYAELSTRHLWLQATINYNNNHLEEALDYLYGVAHVLDSYKSDLSITMSNLKKRNHFTADLVRQSIAQFKRLINLRQTKKLYAEERFAELVDVLHESLLGAEDVESVDQHGVNRNGQIQMMLESLWCEERYEECLQWMERCLTYSVDKYLTTPNHSPSIKKKWAETVNFILIYFEQLLEQEGVEFLLSLDRYFARLIQTLTKLVTNQVDVDVMKTTSTPHLINVRIPWVILYYVVQREDDLNAAAMKDVEDSFRVVLMPNAIQLFFTVHEYLGRKGWCAVDDSKFLIMIIDTVTPRLRTPEFEHVRNSLMETMEQVTYCLYSYPPKKMRSKHIDEHNAKPIELTWERSVQLFDLYKPDELPEFDSFKLLSISSDMEALLQRILRIMPRCLDIKQFTSFIEDYIDNKSSKLPNEMNIMPARIQPIYYLIADFHFKNHDFSKAISYYIQDLVLAPKRFDSWVGLSLSKNKKLVEQLNSCDDVEPKAFLEEAAKCIRCYQQGLKLNDKHRCLWIEYGQLLYHLHSFCARSLKLKSDSLSMDDFHFIEEHKEEYIKSAFNAFNVLTKLAEQANTNDQDVESDTDGDEGQDEKWLYYYMLGKISEKRREEPKCYLDYYLMSAKCLYEKGATYPLKINHMSPSNLAIEALELYYRTTAAMIKYLEQHYTTLSRPNAKYFSKVLRDLTNSPFAINRAKIKGAAAMKRKMATDVGVKSTSDEPPVKVVLNGGVNVDAVVSSTSNNDTPALAPVVVSENKVESTTMENGDESIVTSENVSTTKLTVEPKPHSVNGKPMLNGGVDETNVRRSSHESGVTSTTSNDSSSSSSSSSSGSDSSSDSDSDSSDEEGIVKQTEVDALLKSCIRNLEECVTRFPEHYKSIYRLVYHYLHAKGATKSIDNCRQLLLSTYRTTLGSNIAGIFTDRKANNLFNGVWRIPSDEIDRPGNFSAHLSKCVVTLIDILKQQEDYNTLFDVALLLFKNPESDKKYLIESERKELYQQAILYSSSALKTKFKQLMQVTPDDKDLLKFLIEIYKIHRKTVKLIQPKENPFNSVMTDVYKAYVADKAVIPETANLVDLSIKLCVYETNMQKLREKEKLNVNQDGEKPAAVEEPTTPYIPGLSKKRIEKPKRISFSTVSTPELLRPVPSINTSLNLPSTVSVIPINNNEKSPQSTTQNTTTTLPNNTIPKIPNLSSIIPPLYSNLLPNPSSPKSSTPTSSAHSSPQNTTAAAATALINANTMKNNNNPTSSTAPFDQASLLAELYKTPNLLSAIPGMNLSAMLSLLQQQNQLYSHLSSMTAVTASAAANPGYSNFALKYIESLASNLMSSIATAPLPTADEIRAAASPKLGDIKAPGKQPKTATNVAAKLSKQKSSVASGVTLNSAASNQKVKKSAQELAGTSSNIATSSNKKQSNSNKQQSNSNKHSNKTSLSHLSLPIDLPASLSITPSVSITPQPDPKSTFKSKQQQHNRTEQRPSSSSSSLKQSLSVTPASSPLTISPVPATKSKSLNTPKNTVKPGIPKSVSAVSASAFETLSKLGSSISLIPEKDISVKETSSRVNTSNFSPNAYLLEFTRQFTLGKQDTIDLTASPLKDKSRPSSTPTTATPKGTGKDTPKSSNVGSIRVKKDSKLFQQSVTGGIQIPNSISVSPVPTGNRFSPSPSISPSFAHMNHTTKSNSSNKSYRPINSPSPSSLQYSTPRNVPASISPAPSVSLEISPTKTLQQKLAEKQKENQSRISMDTNHRLKNNSPAPLNTGAIPKMTLPGSSLPTSTTFMREFEKMAAKKVVNLDTVGGSSSKNRTPQRPKPQKNPTDDEIIVLDD